MTPGMRRPRYLIGLWLLTSRVSLERLEFFWGVIPGASESEGLSTLGTRLEIWRWGLVAAGDFPFTGTGLGTWRRVGYRLYPMELARNYGFWEFLQVQQYQGRALKDFVGGWMAEANVFRGQRMVCYHKNWTYFSARFGDD